MKWFHQASIFLTAVAGMNTAEIAVAQADLLVKNRCVADLSRTDPSFCLSAAHGAAGGNALQYEWTLNDKVFDLTSNACLDDGGAIGARRDLVLAIDRSQNVWYADQSIGKFGSDNLATAAYIIEKMRDEARNDPARAPKVSVVLFSSAPDCREWTGGPIAVNREFPCLFVKAASVADTAHVDDLLGLLKAADNKYSQRVNRTSDYGIVADLLQNDGVGLAAMGTAQAGLLLFSDGRTYQGEAAGPNDPYVHLHSAYYARAQDQAMAKFKQPGLKKYQLVFALTPVADPAFDDTHIDLYQNMCVVDAQPADCAAPGIDYTQPKTWPVNRLDIPAFAKRLAQAMPGVANPVVTVAGKQDVEPALEALRFAGATTTPVDAVTYSLNGGAVQAGIVEGGRIYVAGLPTDQAITLDLFLKSAGGEVKIPVSLSTLSQPSTGLEHSDGEMFCEADTALPAKLSLNDLQGGSASCGVISGSSSSRTGSFMGIALMLFPLLVVGAFRARRLPLILAMIGVVTAGVAAESAKAEDKVGGLNALQYRPVVDGVSSTERATTMNAGSFNSGLFVDYANDTVELGGEKNKRINSVMDDLVTAHAVGNVGLHRRISLGVHVPFVHKSDVDRTVDGEETSGGQLGQPSDASAMLKINLITRPTYAIGFMPQATMATGNPDLLLGDGTNSYGALLLFSGTQGQMSWAFNSGYLNREKALELQDDRANSISVRGQVVNYAGAEYRHSHLWSFGGSLQAKFTTGAGVDLTSTNPAEWSALAKLRPLTGLEAQMGFGTGLGQGYGSPDYRVQAGLTYALGSSPARVAAPVRQPVKKPVAKR